MGRLTNLYRDERSPDEVFENFTNLLKYVDQIIDGEFSSRLSPGFELPTIGNSGLDKAKERGRYKREIFGDYINS